MRGRTEVKQHSAHACIIESVGAQLSYKMTTRDAQRTWKQQIKQAEELRQQVEDLKAQGEAELQRLQTMTADSGTNAEAVNSNLQRSNEVKAQLDQLLTDVTTRLEALETSVQQTQARETDTKTLYESLNTDIAGLRDSAKSVVDKVSAHQETITEQLKQAAAAGLFGAFESAKSQHQSAAKFWGIVTFISLIAAVVAGGVLLYLTRNSDLTVEYLLRKFLIVTPFIYWLVICSQRFSKAKRLQEEYTFKSALSLSLEAYRDMLKREAADEVTRTEVVPVLADAVGKLFESPSSSISKYPHKDDKSHLQTALDTMEKLTDLIPKRS